MHTIGTSVRVTCFNYKTSEAELYLLYMEMFSFHTLYISILSHKINLNAKQLPNHRALDGGLF